jgi:hypothetical protein
MATKLDKEITRESTIVKDKRILLVSLTADQTIKFKPKGLRGNNGVIEVSLEDIFDQNDPSAKSIIKKEEKPKKVKVDSSAPMISLHDLRSQSAISGLPTDLIAKFDGIIKNMLDEWYR